MTRSLRHRHEGMVIASALRGVLPLFEPVTIAYTPDTAARCNDVIVAEVIALPDEGSGDDPIACLNHDFEVVYGDGDRLTFARERPRHTLVATCAGNRYAPLSVMGGLTDPLTGRDNPPLRGGVIVDDLSMCNVIGFANFTAAGHRRTRLRVLGVLLDETATPVNLARRHRARPAVSREIPGAVLVCGSSMDAGKTTCSVAIARHLRASGRCVTFEKKTGTACLGDPLKVQIGDMAAFGSTGSRLTVDSGNLRVSDFVDATGMVSDISGDPTLFVERSLAFTPWFAATHDSDIHVIELADNISHVSNLALIDDERFRAMISALVYVPAPSFDAAHHFVSFLRDSLHWTDVPVAFSGRITNDPEWAALRKEIETRLHIPCLPSLGEADGAELAEWVAGHTRRRTRTT